MLTDSTLSELCFLTCETGTGPVSGLLRVLEGPGLASGRETAPWGADACSRPSGPHPQAGPGTHPQDEALPHECTLHPGSQGRRVRVAQWVAQPKVLISKVAGLPSHRVDPVTSSPWEGNESESVKCSAEQMKGAGVGAALETEVGAWVLSPTPTLRPQRGAVGPHGSPAPSPLPGAQRPRVRRGWAPGRPLPVLLRELARGLPQGRTGTVAPADGGWPGLEVSASGRTPASRCLGDLNLITSQPGDHQQAGLFLFKFRARRPRRTPGRPSLRAERKRPAHPAAWPQWRGQDTGPAPLASRPRSSFLGQGCWGSVRALPAPGPRLTPAPARPAHRLASRARPPSETQNWLTRMQGLSWCGGGSSCAGSQLGSKQEADRTLKARCRKATCLSGLTRAAC